MKLLHLDASILGDHSVSRQVSAAIVAQIKTSNPGVQVTYRDLAAEPLPHMTPATLPHDHPLAAMAAAAGAPRGDADVAQGLLDEFLAADVVVIGAPMYNFTIPTQLKAWIDRIVVTGKTFRYGANGVEGLAAGKRVIVALSRGGLYGPGAPAAAAEHAETYLRTIFGFIGVTDVEFIVAEGIQVSPESRAKSVEAALAAAGGLKAA